MTHRPFYPPADRTQWFANAFPGSVLTPNTVVLHTTEGASWPTYDGGAIAPNLTAMPDVKNRLLVWRQHFPLTMSSRALQNLAGGVQTNTLNVVQVELVGTCANGGPGLFWPTAPDWALQGVADFVMWMHAEWGVPVTGAAHWEPYPASFGATRNRMTFAEWTAFKGWCGHQHVPENDHGDPGALPWDRIAALAQPKPAPPKPVPAQPQENEMNLSDQIPGTNDGHGKPITVATLFSRLAGTESEVNRLRDDMKAVKDALAALNQKGAQA